jgi:hypothetical protein
LGGAAIPYQTAILCTTVGGAFACILENFIKNIHIDTDDLCSNVAWDIPLILFMGCRGGFMSIFLILLGERYEEKQIFCGDHFPIYTHWGKVMADTTFVFVSTVILIIMDILGAIIGKMGGYAIKYILKNGFEGVFFCSIRHATKPEELCRIHETIEYCKIHKIAMVAICFSALSILTSALEDNRPIRFCSLLLSSLLLFPINSGTSFRKLP